MNYVEDFTPKWDKLWADVNADIFVRTPTVEKFKERFVNSSHVVYAVENEDVIGYVRILSDGTFAYLPEIWVQPAHRGQGVGTALMNHILNLIPGQHVYIYAIPDGKFFRRFGFVIQGLGLGQKI